MENPLQLTIENEVIEFVKVNIESLELDGLIPVLIYGKFSDENEGHFRISLQERNEFEKYNKNNGTFVKTTGIPDIFINNSFENIVKNKTMVLVNDTVEIK
jgi:hypothetical protein